MIITLSQPLFSRLTDMYTIREVFTVRNSKKNPPKIKEIFDFSLFGAEDLKLSSNNYLGKI